MKQYCYYFRLLKHNNTFDIVTSDKLCSKSKQNQPKQRMSKSRIFEALRHICISNNCDEIRQYLQCAPSKIATQLLTSARLVCLTFVRVLNIN